MPALRATLLHVLYFKSRKSVDIKNSSIDKFTGDVRNKAIVLSVLKLITPS